MLYEVITYFVSYSGAAIPGMVASKLASQFDLFQIALGYGALGIVAALIAMTAIRNPALGQPTA